VSGVFITFEGPDGSGKSTQLKLAAEYLRAKGYRVTTTRDPGGTAISNQIRQVLLRPENTELFSQTEVLLYAASRAQLVHEVILPALLAGEIVLCDRFIDASVAYQAFGNRVPQHIIEDINDYSSSGLSPARTYLFMVTPEQGRARVLGRSEQEFTKNLDRIEQKGIDYHQRVLDGFEHLAKTEDERIMRIDGTQSVEEIAKTVAHDLDNFLKEAYEPI
jgi:dTMP kinase